MPTPAPTTRPTSVLFVCLGNICRSPLAEGVFLHLVEREGLGNHFLVDSAGTGAWHVGELPDPRSRQVAAEHGVELPGRARQVTSDDLNRFDLILAMDRENLAVLERMADSDEQKAKVRLLRSFDPEADDDQVPDPYYGGPRGFEHVFGMLLDACEGLLDELRPPR